MTNRPRSHQIEDQSRFALSRAMPPGWTIERVVHDYGLDLRIEIFDDDRPTGASFFVQLKATDRLPSKRGVSVRLRPKHLDYWNRLPVPTMVALWVAPTDSLYWAWAHRHHPWPRVRQPKMESFRLVPADRLRSADWSAIAAEVDFCARARSGALPLPLEVHLQAHPVHPLINARYHEFAELWASRVDEHVARLSALPRIEQSRVVLSEIGFSVSLGRATLSQGATDHRPLQIEEAVDEVASAHGMLLCSGGNTSSGVALLAAHGATSKLLAMMCTQATGRHPKLAPNPLGALVHVERFDVGLGLAESWLEQKSDDFRAAAIRTLVSLKFYEVRMTDEERSRLNALLGQTPGLSHLLTPEFGFQMADLMAREGHSSMAAAQYDLLSEGADKVTGADDRALERLAAVHRSSAEYDQAAECLMELIKRHPASDRWRLELGICTVLRGDYELALLPLASVADPDLHGEAWCWVMTAGLAKRVGGPSQARQPAGAKEAVRRLADCETPDEIMSLFEEAAKCDAVSVDTWTIYFAAMDSSSPPLGSIGVLPVALLTWDDPEWWALVLNVLAAHGQAEGFLRASECGLKAVGDDLPATIRQGFPLSGFASEDLADVVAEIARLKADNRAIQMRAEGKEGVRPVYSIDVAPPGFQLFDVDLPPIESWFVANKGDDAQD